MYSRRPWDSILEHGYRALADSLYEQGFELDPLELPRVVRYHLDRYFARRDVDLFETTYLIVLRDMLAEKGYPNVSDPLLRRALDAFYAHTQPNWSLEEDAPLMLRTLEAGGYRLGLVSNAGDNQDVFQLVERFDIEPFFDFILTSAACSYRKPHARIFELALTHWNIPVNEIAMVGDSLEADIAGAQALGIYSIWITRRVSTTAARSAVQPDAAIRSLSELPVLLSRVTG
ncbi:MAG: Phosphoglycolate phosphatase [Anaerolineales bacterium]|nr:Phosphoglycolate phosphatase [Anaerolineales bacterium]